MRRALFVAAAFVIGFALPGTTWSKGRTMKIEVRGDHLASPIEFTDPSIVGSFNIWNGPGVRINHEPVHLDSNKQAGAFIDWPKGAISERPAGLQRYEVLFHIDGRQMSCPSPVPKHFIAGLSQFVPSESRQQPASATQASKAPN